MFNHQSNVDIDNRIVCYDIKELGKQLKKIGMLVVQDQVWNRVTINRIGGGLLLLQKQVHLVDVVAGRLVSGTVDGDTVPHLILNYQHTDFFKLLAQFLDVVADNPVINIQIALMIEHIQRTRYIDCQCRCNVCLLYTSFHTKQ